MVLATAIITITFLLPAVYYLNKPITLTITFQLVRTIISLVSFFTCWIWIIKFSEEACSLENVLLSSKLFIFTVGLLDYDKNYDLDMTKKNNNYASLKYSVNSLL